jgi:hypothetical protein
MKVGEHGEAVKPAVAVARVKLYVSPAKRSSERTGEEMLFHVDAVDTTDVFEPLL